MGRVAIVSFLFAGAAFAQLDDARRLSIARSDVIWIAAGELSMGASDRDVAYAVELCLDERPLPLHSFGPESDGGCSLRRFVTEGPRRRVWTDTFGIDRTEVTHRAYRRCVIAGRCAPSRVADDARIAAPEMPVTGVTFAEAEAYCAFAGGRLPTEAEWERAARGDHPRRRFPWGRLYNSRLANHGRSPSGPDETDGFALAAPVGSFPDGASPNGLLDAAGNAWEWTASAPREDDVGLGADARVYRVIRGGSWAHPAALLRVTHRVWVPVGEHRADLGMRCAYDP